MKRAPFLSSSLDAIVSVSSVCLLLSCFRDAGSTLTTLSPLLSFSPLPSNLIPSNSKCFLI